MLERKDPQTGKTAVEEFIEKFVNKNSKLAKKILDMGNIIKNTFLILGNKDDIIFIEDFNRKKLDVPILLG